MTIKVLLIGAVLGCGWMLLSGDGSLRQRAVRRMAGLALVPVAVTAVLFPDAVTALANQVGVTRGTDLVLYAALVTFTFVTLALSQRVHHLERQLTQLARELALRTAAPPAGPPAADPAASPAGDTAAVPDTDEQDGR